MKMLKRGKVKITEDVPIIKYIWKHHTDLKDTRKDEMQ